MSSFQRQPKTEERTTLGPSNVHFIADLGQFSDRLSSNVMHAYQWEVESSTAKAASDINYIQKPRFEQVGISNRMPYFRKWLANLGPAGSLENEEQREFFVKPSNDTYEPLHLQSPALSLPDFLHSNARDSSLAETWTVVTALDATPSKLSPSGGHKISDCEDQANSATDTSNNLVSAGPLGNGSVRAIAWALALSEQRLRDLTQAITDTELPDSESVKNSFGCFCET